MQVRSEKPIPGVLVRIHTHYKSPGEAEDTRISVSADECRITLVHPPEDPSPHVDDLVRLWAEHYVRCHKVAVTTVEYRVLPDEGNDRLLAVRFDSDADALIQ